MGERKAALWAGGLAVLLITAASAAPASGEALDAGELDSALQAIKDGSWTEDDLDYIKEHHPDVAEHTPDPRLSELEVFESPPPQQAAGGSSDRITAHAGVRYEEVTLLRNTAWVWFHQVKWTFSPDTGDVVGKPTQKSWFDEVDPVHQVQSGHVKNERERISGRPGGAEVWRLDRGDHIVNTVLGVTWKNQYPENIMRVDGDGDYYYTFKLNGDVIKSGRGSNGR
ncbi:hypothetical protein [Nocardiopsis potens]|uniref:hypothetical protein n=1 Tax=Nocardiopsis potens TaxID=1246458 RepID=UPI0003454FD1|nr:hypothetical protein [Nocardiopsis potens]